MATKQQKAAVLDAFAKAHMLLIGLILEDDGDAQTAPAPQNEAPPVAAEKPKRAAKAPPAAAVTPAAPAGPKHTSEQVTETFKGFFSKKLKELGGQKEALAACTGILSKFGVKKAGELKPEQYDAFVAAVEAADGGADDGGFDAIG